MPHIINTSPNSGEINDWVNEETEFMTHWHDVSVLRYLANSASRYKTDEYGMGQVIYHLAYMDSICKYTKLSKSSVRRSLQRLQMQGYLYRPGVASRGEPDAIYVMWYTDEDRRRMRQGKVPRHPELWLPPTKRMTCPPDTLNAHLTCPPDTLNSGTPSYISRTIESSAGRRG